MARSILGEEGTINTFLTSLNLIQEPWQLLYTDGAVILGLVYGYLPFMGCRFSVRWNSFSSGWSKRGMTSAQTT